MRTKIQKWGNSLAVRIPKAFAMEAQVAYGTTVDLSVEDGKIIMVPQAEPAFRLEELFQAVNKRNLHGEVESGDAVGRRRERGHSCRHARVGKGRAALWTAVS